MSRLATLSIFIVSCFTAFAVSAQVLFAQSPLPTMRLRPIQTPLPLPTSTPQPTEEAQPALTENTEGPLERLIASQSLGSKFFNPVKYAIRGAVEAGVPANTIVLLLLLPLVAAVIAATRHLIGLRGFGIFLPAALSVVFVATGPLVGLGLFILITMVSLLVRIILKKLHLRLQYLPRMAFILWAVSFAVLAVLFAAPLVNYTDITNVSIFPVLLLALLAEDFTRVQLGKSLRTAFNLTSETLILALASFLVLTFQPIQRYALLNPEIMLVSVAIFDFVVGKYVGLRLMEIVRFRKLISS